MQQETKLAIISVSVTVVALGFAVTHAAWPTLGIDWVSLGFVGLAALPWLTRLFKSFEIAGLLKAETADQKTETIQLIEQATDAKFLVAAPVVDETQPAANDNAFEAPLPLQALVTLRIELNRLVAKLAKAPEGAPRSPVRNLQDLLHSRTISQAEFAAIRQLTVTLNRAIHGEHLSHELAMETLSVGAKIVQNLSDRLSGSISIENLAEQLDMTTDECLDYIFKDENTTGLNYHLNATKSSLHYLPLTIANRLIAQRKLERSRDS